MIGYTLLCGIQGSSKVVCCIGHANAVLWMAIICPALPARHVLSPHNVPSPHQPTLPRTQSHWPLPPPNPTPSHLPLSSPLFCLPSLPSPPSPQVQWLRTTRTDLVVSDVVPIACAAAAQAGIPAVAVTNFSWGEQDYLATSQPLIPWAEVAPTVIQRCLATRASWKSPHPVFTCHLI